MSPSKWEEFRLLREEANRCLDTEIRANAVISSSAELLEKLNAVSPIKTWVEFESIISLLKDHPALQCRLRAHALNIHVHLPCRLLAIPPTLTLSNGQTTLYIHCRIFGGRLERRWCPELGIDLYPTASLPRQIDKLMGQLQLQFHPFQNSFGGNDDSLHEESRVGGFLYVRHLENLTLEQSDPTKRVSGIGSALLELTKEFCRSLGFASVGLVAKQPDWPPTLLPSGRTQSGLMDFYQKHGFALKEMPVATRDPHEPDENTRMVWLNPDPIVTQ